MSVYDVLFFDIVLAIAPVAVCVSKQETNANNLVKNV